MQRTSIHLLRINRIAYFSGTCHCGTSGLRQYIAGVQLYQLHLIGCYVYILRIAGKRVRNSHLAILAGRDREGECQVVVRILIRLHERYPEIFTFGRLTFVDYICPDTHCRHCQQAEEQRIE